MRFEAFRTDAMVSSLGWPDDVVEQFLYDHGDNASFLDDYGDVDLCQVIEDVEVIPVGEFMEMPTGASDDDCIEVCAANPEHWVEVRSHGVHIGVAQCWEAHGTWKRWPILMDRRLLDIPDGGLQVVEGRTERHLAWVGRPST